MQKIAYQEFLRKIAWYWKPGEHIAIVGPTGSGKTYIARDLLELRRYAVVLATKSRDKTLDGYQFERTQTWPVDFDVRYVMLWKKARQLGDFAAQRELIYKALDDIYRGGGWSIYFDDLFYVSETLGLKRAVQMLYTQVRSQEVSLLASMQRPRWVPLEAISQSSYLIAFLTRDRIDVERLSGAMGIERKDMQSAMQALGQYEFVFVRTNEEPIIVEKRTK